LFKTNQTTQNHSKPLKKKHSKTQKTLKLTNLFTLSNMPRTSSSRPTPSRAGQQLPDEASVQYHSETVDPNPQWASKEFTLYISYLHAHVPEKMLFSVMRQTGIGMMKRTGAIELTKHAGADGGYPFQSAKIHFDFLFTRGDQRDKNIQILDHLLHGGEDAHFQVVYQAARHNTKTGKDEPDRFWKIKAWREGQRSASPPDAPSLKISLHGGAVGPKDVKSATVTATKRVLQKRQPVADADGFIQPKTWDVQPTAKAVQIGTSIQTKRGGFAALDDSPAEESGGDHSTSTLLTKTAKKNAKKKAKRQASGTNSDKVAEVANVLSQHVANEMTGEEMDECDAAIDAALECRQPSNDEIRDAAAEFLMESQICEEGAENAASWQMDASAGSMIFHDEMGAEEAATLVPQHQVLDASEIMTAQ
jgi:hypothetical protein